MFGYLLMEEIKLRCQEIGVRATVIQSVKDSIYHACSLREDLNSHAILCSNILYQLPTLHGNLMILKLL